ncbi:MAG: LuxR C-terminal-related transcriptional regulator, partial [Variovorax sp.]
GFFSLFTGQAPECLPLNAQIQQLRDALDRTMSDLERIKSGNSYGQEGQRRQLIGELAQTERLDPVLAFYVERLQAARMRSKTRPAEAETKTGARAAAPGELEEFSEREIEVLRLLAQAMPNKKIARALGLSPETVKWYLSRIYGKLRVAGRDEAVARVRDLGWDAECLSPPG